MPYSDAELETFLLTPESEFLERKAMWSGDVPSKAREAVCAFANDLPGLGREGVLFIGAKDDGSPSGLQITDELLNAVSDIKNDGQMLPPPTMSIEVRNLRGAEMIVVHVRPADSPPVRYKGTVWIRTGPRRGIATPQDEAILSERRRFRDRPFDARRHEFGVLTDLDLAHFRDVYLPSAVSREVLEENGRGLQEQLMGLKFLAAGTDDRITNLAAIVLAKAPRDLLPGAYLQFLRLEGTTLDSTVLDEALISGRVDEVVLRTEEKLTAHNRVKVEFANLETELRSELFPMAALQQLVRNAVMHRTYEHTNAPIRVTWYEDRIEISNPGGPYGSVTPENFGRPGVTDYRNPNLAEAMRNLGLVQRFGVGIQLANAALERNGNPPIEFLPTQNYTVAIVRAG
jgi:ATP-dependent DNA helicase RecG